MLERNVKLFKVCWFWMGFGYLEVGEVGRVFRGKRFHRNHHEGQGTAVFKQDLSSKSSDLTDTLFILFMF